MTSAHVTSANVSLAKASHGQVQLPWGRKQTQSQRERKRSQDLFNNNLHDHIDVPYTNKQTSEC